jgi:hypothetical protein
MENIKNSECRYIHIYIQIDINVYIHKDIFIYIYTQICMYNIIS